MFAFGSKKIRLYTGELAEQVPARSRSGVQKIYASPHLIKAAEIFLGRDDTELQIITEKPIDGGVENHPFIQALEKKKKEGLIKGTVEVRLLKESARQFAKKDNIVGHHFMVMDNIAFRFEFDHKPCKAEANFGSRDVVGALIRNFDNTLVKISDIVFSTNKREGEILIEGSYQLADFASFLEAALGINLAFGLLKQIHRAGFEAYKQRVAEKFEAWQARHCEPKSENGEIISIELDNIQQDWSTEEKSYISLSEIVVRYGTYWAYTASMTAFGMLAFIGFCTEAIIPFWCAAAIVVGLGVPVPGIYAWLLLYWSYNYKVRLKKSLLVRKVNWRQRSVS